MVENNDPGEETIGNATETYVVNKGRFATETGHKDIIKSGLDQKKDARKQRTKPLTSPTQPSE